MFNPKYTITAKLLSNIKQIAVLVGELNNKKYSRVVIVELERSARALSAFSSTSIEGNPLPLTEVKKILKHAPASLRDTEKEVLNYNSALILLSDFSTQDSNSLDKELILKIQHTVVEGLLEKHRIGKFRDEPVFVNNPKTGKTVYLPPDNKDVISLMDKLFIFLKDNIGKIDPLILAGIFHKQFVVIHPFVDGNGRTARLSTKVLLAKLGINTFNLFSFENYYNRNVQQYFDKVGVFGNYYDIVNDIDFTSWLEYFTDGIIDELLRVAKEIERFSVTPSDILKPYHKKILEYIEKNGFITDLEYSKITDRAKATRVQDLNKLVEMDLIQREGKGKNTFYKFKK